MMEKNITSNSAIVTDITPTITKIIIIIMKIRQNPLLVLLLPMILLIPVIRQLLILLLPPNTTTTKLWSVQGREEWLPVEWEALQFPGSSERTVPENRLLGCRLEACNPAPDKQWWLKNILFVIRIILIHNGSDNVQHHIPYYY